MTPTNEATISALRGLVKLIDDDYLVRNTNNDADKAHFIIQGVRIVSALSAAYRILDQVPQTTNEPTQQA